MSVSSHNFYAQQRWRKLAAQIRKRDNMRCAFCGTACGFKGDAIVDHIKPRRLHPELAYDPNNLQLLCKRCHDSTKKRDENNPSRGCDVNGLPNDGSWG